jgi:hypothetical protein
LTAVSLDDFISLSDVHSILYQNISLCPGANYELTFTMATTQSPSAGAVALSVYLFDTILTANTFALAQTSSTLQGHGPYPFSVPASSDTFAFTILKFDILAFTTTQTEGTPFIFDFDDVSVYQV